MGELKHLKRVLAASRVTRQTTVSAQSSTSVQTNPATGMPVAMSQGSIVAQQQTLAALKPLRKAPKK